MSNKKIVKLNTFDNFTKFYNYKPSTKLLNSVGVDTATFPSDYDDLREYPLNISALGLDSVNGVVTFKQYYPESGKSQYRLLLYGSDKKVYINQMFNQDYGLYWLYGLQFNSAPITLAYKKNNADAVIIASDDEMKIWKANYSPYTITGVPIITSMCMNEGVLFCTIKEPAFKVWYATDLDAENVGNISNYSGYISLEDDLGYARKILTFNQQVYVFRDYGITKINYIKNQVSISQVYSSNTRIYTNTISQCGNVILFMTSEGLYTFNGVKVSKTSLDISSLLTKNNNEAVASSLGEKYYLALRLNFNDDKQILCEAEEYVNNAILIVNTSDFSYEIIRGVDVKSFLPMKTELCEKMLLTFNSVHHQKLGQIVQTSTCFGVALPKYWVSGNLVDDLKPKIFTKLQVVADKDVKFNLHFKDKNISFTSYKSGLNEFCFKIYSNQIKLSISSSLTSAQVENVSLEYYEN